MSSNGTVAKKYFPIFGALKSETTDLLDRDTDKAIKLSLREHAVPINQEECLLCKQMIDTESESMEVHVNMCLDSQLKDSTDSNTKTIDNSEMRIGDNNMAMAHNVLTDSSSITNTGCSDNSDNELLLDQCKQTSIASTPKRTLPSSWKSCHSYINESPNKVHIISPSVPQSENKTGDNKVPKKSYRMCPFYKRIKDTRFVVDAFSYGSISDCDGYFLSHYHSDHFMGLRSNWSHGTIYCSKITANLVKQELRVDSRYIHPLPMNQLYSIPNSNVSVGLIDANHCPGSVLFLFVIEKSDKTVIKHLHTGDFRATPRMCLHPLISQSYLQCLYLDTTYMKPEYSFPAQEECIRAVCDVVKQELEVKVSFLDKWIKPHREPITPVPNEPILNRSIFDRMMAPPVKYPLLIVVGTYTIGKERVFYNIAKTIQSKIYVTDIKKRILLCQENQELTSMLTNNPYEAQVHVISLREIRPDNMSKYHLDHQHKFQRLLAFKPTGWTYKSTKIETSDMKLSPLSHIITPPTDRTLHLSPSYHTNRIKIYSVPYSEHSSFRELASFIASLNIRQIIPTVNIQQVQEMAIYFRRWEEEKKAKAVAIVPYPNEDHW
ncbi:DNA repair metallo-beta-lactamase-domain-containing protein [Pilobolus umbonatus]|nr:DNA repair metallo-beta-lactamase-domain-containing protein [Pilobolus umbonatus]